MRHRINARTASKYLFLLPGFIMFAFAMLIPFFMGINIAFTDWNGITRDYNYVGFENFIRAFSDSRLRQPIITSFKFMVLGTTFGTIVSLGLALLVHNRLIEQGRLAWTSRFARTAFFAPVCVSAVLTAFLGKFVYGSVFSELFGVRSFLGMRDTVIPAIVALGIWNGSGINMLIYYSGLKSIPSDLYEAARVDGAGPVYTFFRVTLPLLSAGVLGVRHTVADVVAARVRHDALPRPAAARRARPRPLRSTSMTTSTRTARQDTGRRSHCCSRCF